MNWKKNPFIFLLFVLGLLFCLPIFITTLYQPLSHTNLMFSIVFEFFIIIFSVFSVLLAWRRKGKWLKIMVMFSLLVLTVSSFTVLSAFGEDRRLVGAYYYMWYSESSWSLVHSDFPALGAYNSADETVISQHLSWARDYGIDFFVVSMFNDDYNDRRHSLFTLATDGDTLRLAMMIEPKSMDELNVLAETVWNEFAGYNCYLYWDGKPLIFVYTQYMSYVNLYWVDSRFTVRFIPTQVPYCNENLQMITTVDAVSVACGGNITYLQIDRKNGEYYSTQWELALIWSRANSFRNVMVLITSFNEWWEDTSIEPANTWGYLYLEKTLLYSNLFKST